MKTAQAIESILVVTRRTELEGLVAQQNSKAQASFFLRHRGVSFKEYEEGHERYMHSVDFLKNQLPRGVKAQIIDRSFLPSYKFSGHELVIVIGPDGLVINTAKYLTHEPILALNPDPARVDGVLIPFSVQEARPWIDRALRGAAPIQPVSMAKAQLNDGQEIHAVNDLFIGMRSHVSARYRLRIGERRADHISSGIIVSTGAGSTGWLSSVLNGAAAIGVRRAPIRLPLDARDLIFAVREPFASKVSQTDLSFGKIGPNETLVVESQMPENGVIFSDGIENDFLRFNSGAIATISLAERKAHLICRDS